MTPQTPQQLAAAAIAAAARYHDREALRQRVAAEHNLPPQLGEFLYGQDAGELAEQAHKLAVACGLKEDPEATK